MKANGISRQWFAFRLQVDREDGPVVPSGSLQLSRVQQSRVIRIHTVIESVLNLGLIYEPDRCQWFPIVRGISQLILTAYCPFAVQLDAGRQSSEALVVGENLFAFSGIHKKI